MRILVFTHMYPVPGHPEYGIFVQQQVESLRRLAIQVDVLHVNVKRSKLLYPWSAVPLWQRAYTARYDLVHAHYVFAGIVARSQFRSPLVITHHGDETFHGWQAPLCWAISRLADRTIVVSEQVKRAIGLESAEVIPCGVDFELFRPMPHDWAREQLGLPADRRLVLFAGDVSKALKRFDLAQAGVAQLQAAGTDAQLVVAYKQPYSLMPLYMNACDVLLMPSEREGSPQVVKEALACNLPVVATAVGDVPRMLDGVPRCFVCERDASDVAAKVSMAMASGQRADSRDKRRRYDLMATAKQIAAVYEDILRQKR